MSGNLKQGTSPTIRLYLLPRLSPIEGRHKEFKLQVYFDAKYKFAKYTGIKLFAGVSRNYQKEGEKPGNQNQKRDRGSRHIR